MNDRYLYKAKRKHDSKFFKKGEWVEGAYYIEPYTDKCFIIQWNSTGLGFNEFIEVYGESVCQCTGLKDKNGKLIFENDIVKFDVYEYEKLVSSTVSEIKWCEELCSLSVVVNKQGIRGTLGHFLDLNKEVEVIGSAIDNPELLEVGE